MGLTPRTSGIIFINKNLEYYSAVGGISIGSDLKKDAERFTVSEGGILLSLRVRILFKLFIDSPLFSGQTPIFIQQA